MLQFSCMVVSGALVGLSPSDTPEQGDETGIWSCTPQACKQHSFREAVAVGATSLSPTDVLTILGEIADQWPMNSYDLLRRNCCHFCDEFCHLLGLGPLSGVGAKSS